MIHPQIYWGLWNRHTWWGHWALDCRHEGLCTVAIQKHLHKLCSWRLPFSTRLQNSEWRLSSWHCSVLIPSVWWQLAQRKDNKAGRQHLDDAAASRGSSEHHCHIHTHTNAQKHSKICTCRHVFTHSYTNIYCRPSTHGGLADMGF